MAFDGQNTRFHLRASLALTLLSCVSFGPVACTKTSSLFKSNEYTFPGLQSLTAVGDGTYLLSWTDIPGREMDYRIYSRLKADDYDFNEYTAAVSKQKKWTTPDLTFLGDVCYVVRYFKPGLVEDTNTNELCTGGSAYTFTGLKSATVDDLGKVTLSWDDIPNQKGIVWQIFASINGSAYNYGTATYTSTTNLYTVDAYPLSTKYCFVVRYAIVGAPADTNTNEVCPDLAYVTGFDGVASGTSNVTGAATLSWAAPTNATGIVSYRVYKGIDFKTQVASVTANNTSALVGDLVPDETFEFGVRAVDKYGREDANTRTVAVAVANNSAPSFTGLSSATAASATSATLTWLAADGKPKEYKIYKATGASGSTPTVTYTTAVKTVTAPATSTTVTGLGDAQTHCFVARAASSGGQTDTNTTSKCITTTDNGAPIFDGIKSVSYTNAKARLSWDAAIGETAIYKIYYQEGTTLNFATATIVNVSGSLTTYDIAGLADQRSWTFAVRAVDSLNQADTNTVTMTQNAGDLTPPVFSGYVSSTALSEQQIQVVTQRSAESDVSLYTFKYRVSGSSSDYIDGAIVSQPGAGNVTGTITNLSPGVTYEILVKVTDTSGNVSTNVATLTKKTLDTTAPAFGGIVSVIKKPGDPSIAVASWTAATDASGILEYRVYYSKGALTGVSLNKEQSFPRAENGQQVYMSAAVNSGTTLEVPSLDTLSTYYFVVHAIDNEGNEDTNALQFGYSVPDFTPPAAPVVSSVTPDTSTARTNRFPVVAGTGTTGMTIRVYVNGTLNASTDINSGTAYSVTLALPNTSATYVITVKQKNSEDIESTAANGGSYVLDVTPPVITLVQNATPSSIGDANSSAPQSTVIFSSDKGGTYALKEGSTTISTGSVTAGVNKTLTITSAGVSSGDGTKTLTIAVTDAGGNIGTQNVSIAVDSTAPPHVTDFQVVRDDQTGKYKFSWTATGLAATDVLKIWKVSNTLTTPSNMASGAAAVADVAYNVSSVSVDVGVETLAAFRVFPCDSVGNCNLTACSTCAASIDSGLTFQNMSEGDILKFKWTDTANASTVRGGYSKDVAAMYAWDGVSNTIASGAVMTEADANCNSGTTCSTQFASDAAWTRRYFRVSSTNTAAGGNGVWLSKLRYWAKVPSGMVYVAKEDWPDKEYKSVREVATDFAIDKYEAYETTTAANPGGNAGSTAYPNAYNKVLKSASGQTPKNNIDWWRAKQGCENRSKETEFADYVKSNSTYYASDTSSPRRKFHLPTGLEWFVAAYGTPDTNGSGNCNTDNRNSSQPFATGSSSTQNCISYFGAMDMIGNLMEVTDERTSSPTIPGSYWNNTLTTYYGTGFEQAQSFSITALGNLVGYNVKTGLPSSSDYVGNSSTYFSGDLENYYHYNPSTARRGGHFTNGTAAGRYAVFFYYHPGESFDYSGARCALAAPAPRLTKFQNDSEGNLARFYWKVDNFDTETIGSVSATEVYLAFGSDKNEVDIWDGTPTMTLTNGGILKFTTDGGGNQSLSSVSGSGLSSLTCQSYTPISTLYSGKCSIDLSAAPLSLSPWSKRFFKLFARNASYGSSASHGVMSSTVGVGYAPPGMVMVAKEDWPVETDGQIGTWDYKTGSALNASYDGVTGPFDYAIDKYESYYPGATANNPSTVTGNQSAYPSSYNGVSLSAANQTPIYNTNWFTFKQLCENRTIESTYSTFVGNTTLAQTATTGNPRRRVHLATDAEWMVAAFGTPDTATTDATDCNNNSRGTPLTTGSSNTSECISRYGARDMAGNLAEWTDSYWASIAGGTYTGSRTIFYGTGGSAITDSAYTLPSTTDYLFGFSFAKMLPSQIGGRNNHFFLDRFATATGQRVGVRGGAWNWTSGRYTYDLDGPTSVVTSYGGRCALVAP